MAKPQPSKPNKKGRHRINEGIRVPEVRVIDDQGNQLGVLSTDVALERARDLDMDLVEVAPDASPPVCRLMDFGKFKYNEKKRQHESARKQHRQQLKEVRLRPKTEENDYQVKLKRTRKFLEQGHKVQVNLLFRGREVAHQDRARTLLDRFAADLEDLAKVEGVPRMEGRRMNMVISVKPQIMQRIRKRHQEEEKQRAEKKKSARLAMVGEGEVEEGEVEEGEVEEGEAEGQDSEDDDGLEDGDDIDEGYEADDELVQETDDAQAQDA